MLSCELKSGVILPVPFEQLKEDYPCETAKCIKEMVIGLSWGHYHHKWASGLNLMEAAKPDFGNQNCKFHEELDDKFPEPLMKEIGATIFVDSNDGNDKVTGRSITGLMSSLGSTPVNWLTKRKYSCLTSTFGAEFVSLKKEVEKSIVMRCYCRSFGIKVTILLLHV